MADVRPFRAVRYDISRVGTLADVIAPPYDVIDSSFQDKLYEASPYNVIRLELNREEASDSPGSDRYARAASFLKEWKRQGVLKEDHHPAFYLYHQTFEVGGRSFTRRGFFARVRLEPFGQGRIYPHEQTLSGPKADRLALYHATQYNLSPVFGLYPDSTNQVLEAVQAKLRDRTPLEAVDHLGVVNRLWPIEDPETHSTVQGLMASKPIFIADGHHRYETGLKYRDDLASSGELAGPDDPANFVMMMLVGMTDPGLLILPTHRLVQGFPGLSSAELVERLVPEFDCATIPGGPDQARTIWNAIEEEGEQNVLGFGTVADGGWVQARLRSDATMDTLVPEHSAEWRSLGVSILQELVLKRLLGDLGTPALRYVHLVDEVIADVSTKNCDLACLVPPARMEHVESVASNLEKMPPKSTYFYPKLLTGLVLNPLR